MSQPIETLTSNQKDALAKAINKLPPQSLATSGAVTLDAEDGVNLYLDMTGNCTVTLSNTYNGQSGMIYVRKDADAHTFGISGTPVIMAGATTDITNMTAAQAAMISWFRISNTLFYWITVA